MNRTLIVAVLVALCALNAESFRVVRQAEEEAGTLARFTGGIRSYYDSAINTASEYLDSIKGLKLEEKASNLYTDTTTIISTYASILQDQIYHHVYSQ